MRPTLKQELVVLAVVLVGHIHAGISRADEVIIREIAPDGTPVRHPASQPGLEPSPPNQSASGQPMQLEQRRVGRYTSMLLTEHSGDGMVDPILRELCLTPDQLARINPIIKAVGEANQRAQLELRKANQQIDERLKAARTAAQAAGHKEFPPTPEELEIYKEQSRTNSEYFRGMQHRRDALVAQIKPILTPDEIEAFQDKLDVLSADSAVAVPAKTRVQVRALYPAVQWNDEQRAKVIDIWQKHMDDDRKRFLDYDSAAAPLVRRLQSNPRDVAAKAELDELRKKHTSNWGQAQRQAKEQIDALLTDEQKAAAEQGRLELRRKFTVRTTASIASKYESVGLTSGQGRQLAELVDAANAAMLDMPPNNQSAWAELRLQLQRDLEKLLTPEQKRRLASPAGQAGD